MNIVLIVLSVDRSDRPDRPIVLIVPIALILLIVLIAPIYQYPPGRCIHWRTGGAGCVCSGLQSHCMQQPTTKAHELAVESYRSLTIRAPLWG